MRLVHDAWILLIALTVISPLLAHAQNEPPPVAVSEKEAHRPTAIPDRISLTWTGDTTTTQAVTWRTDTSVKHTVAQIAVAEDGPQFSLKAKDVAGVWEKVETDLGDALYHTVEFTGLAPATAYLYRVGDGTNWSEWIAFKTASATPEPFKFIYFGDAQNDVKSHWSRVIRQAYTVAPDARFVIHAGDLINDAKRDAEWGEWFYAGGWVHAMLPGIATPGNHEYTDRDKEDRPRLARHWRPQFALPTNGPVGLEETAYYVDYQGVRVVSLNSNEKQVEQVEWLDKVLSDNPNRWTILTFHHPIFAAVPQRDNELIRTHWKPLIDKHRVDLVLQGHDHTYARSGLIGENVADGARVESGGTVYVVSISGPKMYPGIHQGWMHVQANGKQLFQVIAIEGDVLRYTSYKATGEPFDRFELHKTAGGSNRLVEVETIPAGR